MRETIDKIIENRGQIDPETAWPRICESVVPQSASEEAQRRPKSTPERPQGLLGAYQSVPGVSQERLGNTPRPSWERSKIRRNTPKAPQSVSEAIWGRFREQNGTRTMIFKAVAGVSCCFLDDVLIVPRIDFWCDRTHACD